MSSDMLSQDEIDALLKQAANSSEDDLNINNHLSPMEQDALGEIGNISFGSASTALSTLLGQKVEITTPKISCIHKDNIVDEFPSPHVATHVQYLEGLSGINLLVIKARDAKIIADLMLGGTGLVEDDQLSEMDVSAVQEAMNQMMGSAATSMSTIFNRIVNISPPGIDVIDLPQGQGHDNIPDEDILVKVSFRLKIGELIDSNIMQMTTIDFAKTMVRNLLGYDNPNQTIEEVPASAPNRGYNEKQPVSVPPSEPQYTSQPGTQPASYPNYEQHSSYQEPKRNSEYANARVQTAQFADFETPRASMSATDPNLDLLLDIPLQITVELGRTKKLIRDILELSQGSIIELDKLAGEPVDIFANNKLIAKGEVVVIDENFGVRVTDILSQYERIRKLQ